MQGRKGIPSKLKLLTGNPGKRPINKNEPEPQRGIPELPEWLREFPVAVEEWNREAEILDGMGVLTVAEGGALAMRSYLASEIQTMAIEIKNEGRVAYMQKMDFNGNEIYEAKTNPKCVQIKNMITEYRMIGSLLGLDPSSRTRLTIIENGKKSKFEGLMNGPKKQRQG